MVENPHITFSDKKGNSISFYYEDEVDLYKELRKLHIPLDQFMACSNSKDSQSGLPPLPEELSKYEPIKQINLGNKTYFVSLRNDLLPELLCARTIAYFKYKNLWCKVKHPDTLCALFKLFQENETHDTEN